MWRSAVWRPQPNVIVRHSFTPEGGCATHDVPGRKVHGFGPVDACGFLQSRARQIRLKRQRRRMSKRVKKNRHPKRLHPRRRGLMIKLNFTANSTHTRSFTCLKPCFRHVCHSRICFPCALARANPAGTGSLVIYVGTVSNRDIDTITISRLKNRSDKPFGFLICNVPGEWLVMRMKVKVPPSSFLFHPFIKGPGRTRNPRSR